MTNEEMQKTMEFILNQQAQMASKQAEIQHQNEEYEQRTKARIEFIIEHQAKHEIDIQNLTSVVTGLAMQVEADHQITQNAINSINNAVVSINNNIAEMKEQANKDRTEIRSTVNQLAATIDKLVGTIINVHSRVSHLEDKAS